MKTLVMTGSHLRNIALLENLYNNNEVEIVGLILFERENLTPEPDENLSSDLKKLWKIHFQKRKESEKNFFDFKLDFLNKIKNKLYIKDKKDFNSNKVCQYVKSLKAEACFISGVPIIKSPLLEIIPNYTINLHLGIIPNYKGAITMFWPFYNLQPSMAGTTYHIIDKFVDTGEIIHQNVPVLKYGDGMHDVSCKALMAALDDLNYVVKEVKSRIQEKKKVNKDFTLKRKGKLFKNSDWNPEMLKKIYLQYNDKIVDMFLSGELKSPKPNLIKIKG